MSKQKNRFFVEAKIKEWNGTNNVTIDRVNGNVDSVVIMLTEKYTSKRLKKNLLEKIGYAFNLAGKEMEEMIK
jgi:hypothetical protein